MHIYIHIKGNKFKMRRLLKIVQSSLSFLYPLSATTAHLLEGELQWNVAETNANCVC